MSTVRILHLEDSAQDHELVTHKLATELKEVEIRRAASKQEFLDSFEAGHYDLVLADYSLPDFDGLRALRYVRERYPDMPFIFVSGAPGEEIAIETLKDGATDYVLKKRLERLSPSVKRALQESQEREHRRKAEEALQETEQRFQMIADAAPVMIWMTSGSPDCVFFNQPWLAFTGRPMEEQIGTGWMAGIHPDDVVRWMDTYESHFGNRTQFTVELRLRRYDQEYRWLVVNGAPRFSPSGEFLGFVGSCIDLTELKQAEERLRHVAKLESLGILAGGIAHDFNNLLTGIIGHAHLLLEDLNPTDYRHVLVDNIIQAGNTAAQLTRQMLAYSGRGRFVIEPLSLTELVSENSPLIEASIPRKVSLVLDLERSLPSIEADPSQIQQIVMNLAINGGEACETNQGTVRLSTYCRQIREGCREQTIGGERIPPGSYVVLEVADDGEGMSPATQARIFDPFFTTKFTGRGLGLAAVTGIVRGHKGAMQLTSAPGQGSTFRVFFPQSEMRVAIKIPLPERATSAGSGLVLAVDDVELVLNTIRMTLTRAGYEVITAENGKDALAIVRERGDALQMVLLDMTMSLMSGEQALSHIKTISPDLPVIGMSGFSEAEAVQRFGGQLDGFVQKPFLGSKLVRKIQEVLDQAGANRSTPKQVQ